MTLGRSVWKIRAGVILKRSLLIHGVPILVETARAELLRDLEHDFDYFLHHESCRTEQTLHLRVSSLKQRPKGWRRLFRGPRSTLFRSPRGEQRVCFFEKAWVSYRFRERRCEIFCDDSAIAYEVLYLVILSFAGESLDLRGFHRVHGLGLARGKTGVLLLARSGGGKSTLALELLKSSDMDLLSDDTPLLSRPGRILAFPQRIAVKERPQVETRYVRKFARVEYGEKFVIGSKYFRHRVCQEAPLNWLVLLENRRAVRPKIVPIARWRLVAPLVKWLVLGYETPQVWELFLRPSARDLLAKCGVLGRRTFTAVRILGGCRAASLTLSDCPAAGVEALNSFLGGGG